MKICPLDSERQMKFYLPSETHLTVRAGIFSRAAAPSNPAALLFNKRQNLGLIVPEWHRTIAAIRKPAHGAVQWVCNGILLAVTSALSGFHLIFQMSAPRLTYVYESPSAAVGPELAPYFLRG